MLNNCKMMQNRNKETQNDHIQAHVLRYSKWCKTSTKRCKTSPKTQNDHKETHNNHYRHPAWFVVVFCLSLCRWRESCTYLCSGAYWFIMHLCAKHSLSQLQQMFRHLLLSLTCKSAVTSQTWYDYAGLEVFKNCIFISISVLLFFYSHVDFTLTYNI